MKLLGKDKFRYFLTYRSVRTQIYLSPRGWDTNSKVRYSRNKEYFGVFRSWALPLDFVYDGADLLRKAYYNGSIETAVKIEVEELNDQTLEYELGFIGDIDFSGKKDDGTVFSVTLMESGPGAKIQAYDDLKNEFPLVGDDVVTMILPGIVFTEASDSIFIPFVDTPPKRYVPETSLVTEGFQSGFADVQSTSREAMTDNGFEPSVNWFAKANRDVSLKVKGSISGTYRSFPFTDNTGFRVELTNSDKSDVRLLYNSPTGGRNDYNFQFDYDETFDMVEGERLFFYVRNNSTSSAQNIQINDGSLNVSYEDVSDPSECKGLRAIDLFKRIMDKVAPGYAADSVLLSAGRWKDLIFTCGDGIREIDAAKIKWSLSDMFKTINGIDDAALGIDNEVTRIENGYYFARNAQICSVGVVSSCELDPATEFMFSKLKIGYKDGNTDDLNGKEEYNSEQEWQSPITRVQTPQDWTSAARADQFGVEKLRTEYNIKKTTKGTYDIGSDNDVFMFDCYLDGDVYRPILGSTYDSVTGLSSPDSAYNLDLSPKANLLRKGSYLAGVFHNMQNLYINFASATKNADLSVTKNGVVVKQNTAIPINSLPAPYFLPEVAKIKCKLPVAARQMFASNPFGFIHFVFKDTNFYGYILDAAIDIARNTEQEFQLLLTPNTFLPGYVNKVRNIGKQEAGSVPGIIAFNFDMESAYVGLLQYSVDGGETWNAITEFVDVSASILIRLNPLIIGGNETMIISPFHLQGGDVSVYPALGMDYIEVIKTNPISEQTISLAPNDGYGPEKEIEFSILSITNDAGIDFSQTLIGIKGDSYVSPIYHNLPPDPLVGVSGIPGHNYQDGVVLSFVNTANQSYSVEVVKGGLTFTGISYESAGPVQKINMAFPWEDNLEFDSIRFY